MGRKKGSCWYNLTPNLYSPVEILYCFMVGQVLRKEIRSMAESCVTRGYSGTFTIGPFVEEQVDELIDLLSEGKCKIRESLLSDR